MLSSVIIMLREVLEASLIISVLLASSRFFSMSYRWIMHAAGIGFVAAVVLAFTMGDISEMFEGVGQELLIALMLLSVSLMLGASCLNVASHSINRTQELTNSKSIRLLFSAIVVVSIAREGTEILIYGYAFSFNLEMFLPVLMGGFIGAGIGASLGALIYFGLVNIPQWMMVRIITVLLTLMSASMASEAVLNLIQASWLPSMLPLWDSSKLLPESSVLGQLLHALVGYEASPTVIQVGIYLFIVLGLALILRKQYKQSAVP